VTSSPFAGSYSRSTIKGSTQFIPQHINESSDLFAKSPKNIKVFLQPDENIADFSQTIKKMYTAHKESINNIHTTSYLSKVNQIKEESLKT
jgi:hypothetical protein